MLLNCEKDQTLAKHLIADKSLYQEFNFFKDQAIFFEGQLADGFYYIEKGYVRIFKMDELGKELEIATLVRGDFFGEVVIFAKNTFPVNAQSLTNSKLFFFAKAKIIKKIADDKKALILFLELLANKCLTLNQKLDMLTLKNTRQRLIQYLFSLCSGDKKCLISLPIKKNLLAKTINTTPETLSRMFKKLEAEGLIKVDKSDIKINNCPLLKQELF